MILIVYTPYMEEVALKTHQKATIPTKAYCLYNYTAVKKLNNDHTTKITNHEQFPYFYASSFLHPTFE